MGGSTRTAGQAGLREGPRLPRPRAGRIRVTEVVAAKPGRIFDLLATPYRLPDVDPTGATLSDDNASPVTALGQVFRMNMVSLDGAEPPQYQADHRVTEFEHNRLIGWTVAPVDGDQRGWSWRFELSPLDGKGKGKGKRTVVAITVDWSEASEENLVRFGILERYDEADLAARLTRLAIEVKK